MLKVEVANKPTVFSVYSDVPETDAINVAVVCERRKDIILEWERAYPEAKILGDVSKVYRFTADCETCAHEGVVTEVQRIAAIFELRDEVVE